MKSIIYQTEGTQGVCLSQENNYREKIEEIGSDERHSFTGEFARYGLKRGWKGRQENTVLLLNIKDVDGNILTDHLWFNLTKQFEKLDLKEGDTVKFNARVQEYTKGYFGYKEDVYKPFSIDYKLSYPTNIQIVN